MTTDEKLDQMMDILTHVMEKVTKIDITIENIIEPKIQLLYEQRESLVQKSDFISIKEDIRAILSNIDCAMSEHKKIVLLDKRKHGTIY